MDNEPLGSVLHLIITGLVGTAYFFVGQYLYPILTGMPWQPLGIAVYFLLFAIVMLVTMLILNQVRHDYSFWITHRREDVWKDSYRRAVMCAVAIFALAGILEFFYELGKARIDVASSYIFVIDDSGSMSVSDPEQKRALAIETIMSKQAADFPYAVYGFTTDAQLLREMAPYKRTDHFSFSSSGGTDVLGVLNQVLEDLSDGTLDGSGSSPRILLLSDGESNSFGWQKIADDSRDSNVVISSIGFGYDSGLLRNIAERTGGVFVQVDDIDDLQVKMETAISSSAVRNLISSRVMANPDWLYAIMRVVFLSIIGVAWSYMKFNSYCSASGKLNGRVLVLSLIWCTLSSLLVEVMFQLLWIPPALVRMTFCVLWALTPGFFAVDRRAQVKKRYQHDVPFRIDSVGESGADVLVGESIANEQGVYTLDSFGSNMGDAGRGDAFQNIDSWGFPGDEADGGSAVFSDEDPFR